MGGTRSTNSEMSNSYTTSVKKHEGRESFEGEA
jgi:hypothetical protein